MKRILFLFIFICVVVANIFSQKNVILDRNSETKATIIENNAQNLIFEINIADFQLSNYKAASEDFTRIYVKNYYPNNEIGFPQLPVFAKLIEIPTNCEANISIIDAKEQTINLKSYGFENPIFPNQPSVSKNKNNIYTEIVKNANIYINNKVYFPENVQIKKQGSFRGTEIAQIIVCPFSYDISTKMLTVQSQIRIKVEFMPKVERSDIKKLPTSREFGTVYSHLWNKQKNTRTLTTTSTPLKYLIISDPNFQPELQPFIEWKTKEGYKVTCKYTNEIGTTTGDIKNYIENVYMSASANDPAPSFVLFVGDVELIPTFIFGSQGNAFPYQRRTDLYYFTMDGAGDFIPDMYYGRLSVSTPPQLTAAINKIITYEQYSFSDENILENVLSIAGNDYTFGPTALNGQYNYANTYYLNSQHNINSITYYYPNSINQVPEIINDMSAGNSSIFYCGHGSYTAWSHINITASVVNSLTNFGNPAFVVANCCQSGNYAHSSECIGESFLRANNRGAATYIGASSESYWWEDYYWTVGNYCASPILYPTYEETGHGIYDKLFHENGETVITNAGEIVFEGNMSVMESTSEIKNYYWEIYNILGDPSLKPYMGMPSVLHVNHLQQIPQGMPFINVFSDIDSYVAISSSDSLIDAQYVDNQGFIHILLPTNLPVGTILNVVATKQFHKTYLGQIIIVANNLQNDLAISQIIDPLKTYSNPSAIIPQIEIFNLGSNTITQATISYTINGANQVDTLWNGNLTQFSCDTIAFPQINLPSDTLNFNFFVTLNNDEDLLNDSLRKQVIIYAGNIELAEIINPATLCCGETMFEPEIKIKNIGTEILTDLRCIYWVNNSSDTVNWTGNLAAGDSTNIVFPIKILTKGNHQIDFYIESPNGGINENKNTFLTRNFMNYDNHVKIQIKTDDYADEMSWDLVNAESGTIVATGKNYPEKLLNLEYNYCLPDSCFKFTIYDSEDDGMCYWGEMGNILIINGIDTILNLSGDEYLSKYEKIFCFIDSIIICPQDFEVIIADTIINLSGSYPANGTYSGTGIVNNSFNPLDLGLGTHQITYSANDLTCNFTVTIVDSVNSLFDFNNDSFIIYPNPVTRQLTIVQKSQTGTCMSLIDNVEQNREAIINLKIYDISGRVVCTARHCGLDTQSAGNNDITIDVSNLQQGVYFIKLSNDSNIFIKKFIKQN